MQNIKDVWEKSIKIKQLRSLFSHDFGTTITTDMIPKAKHDPNRTKTFLSQDYQAKVAQAIEAKRNASTNDIGVKFGLPSI
jgi:hypothetical protein